MKKQLHPLVGGTLLLTAAGLMTRLIGFFYKIFLSRTIGAEGIGIYQMIFPIYGVCYALTTSGAEIAVSRFVSRENGTGRPQSARQVLRVGLLLALGLAIPTAFLLYENAAFLAQHLLRETRTGKLLRIMAFTIPFGACHSCICGYYYGLKKPAVPAAAQLFEQLSRVGAVFLIYRVACEQGAGLSPLTAVVGLVIGEFASMLFCVFCVSGQSAPPGKSAGSPGAPSPFSLTRQMLAMALPVTGNRLCMNLLASAESILLPLCLQQYGLSTKQALSVYGTLSGMALSFILFPSVLTGALSVMLLPSVSESQAAGDDASLSRTVRKTVSFCLPLGISFTVLFLLFGRFLGNFFFRSTLAGDFIITLAWICPFLYLNHTLHSILNGLGRTGTGFFNNLAGILIRILFVLCFVPRFGIEGYLWGLLAGQLVVCGMNVGSLKDYLHN